MKAASRTPEACLFGTASTSSRGTFWAGYHEALRFLSALSHSILSLPFPSHLELV